MTPPTSARKSSRLGSASRTNRTAPNAVEKALRRAAARNLDAGPSSSVAHSSVDDVPCDDSFSALAGVPLGHLSNIAPDSAIVFRGEKGPALEQIASLQAREILEGRLAAARARAAALAESVDVPTNGLWVLGSSRT